MKPTPLLWRYTGAWAFRKSVAGRPIMLIPGRRVPTRWSCGETGRFRSALMLSNIRVAGKVFLIASYTAPMMLAQSIALRTGWWSERILPQLWHRLSLKVMRVHVSAQGEPARGKPVLLVANHVSWTDILVLGSITGVHFVSKAEVRNWPVMGQFARLQRSVFIERERRRASPEQAREIAERLSDGDPVVLFAEGTTGDGNSVLPFKSTLFGA